MSLMDEIEIKRLREQWAYGRDYCEWDVMAGCFHPGATIDISWYQGDVPGFVAASEKMASELKPGARLKHWLGNSRATVVGNRAVLETDVIIMLRNYIDGHLFDIASRARFYDLVEKRNGAWKMTQWKMIYDADRMDAVHPGKVPHTFYEGIDLSDYPEACAYLCLYLEKSGRKPVRKIATHGSADEAAIKAEAKQWLKGGKT